jgi:integrase
VYVHTYIIGKRNQVRRVPMPSWTKQAIDDYAILDEVQAGIVFRPINKGGRFAGERMTEQAIYNLVVEYAHSLSLGKLAPHDLWRTFAKSDPIVAGSWLNADD